MLTCLLPVFSQPRPRSSGAHTPRHQPIIPDDHVVTLLGPVRGAGRVGYS